MGAPRDGTAIADAVQRGFYFRALDGWLRTTSSPDQLLVLQYERCVADRDDQLDATFAHLGLASPPPSGRGAAGPRPDRQPPGLDDDVRQYLTRCTPPTSPPWPSATPASTSTLWPNFAYLTGSADPPASGPNSPTRRP